MPFRSWFTRFAVGATLLIILLDNIWLSYSARLFFDFFDMSAFLDAGWRVACGQTPYVDFFYIAGPVHLWVHAFFFRLMGFGQQAVIAHLLSINTLAILLFASITWPRVRPLPAVLLITLFAISFFGPIAHPWYDQTAFVGFLLGLLGVDLADSTRRGRIVAGGFLAGVGVAFAYFTKSNFGVTAAVTCAVALAIDRARVTALAAYIAGIVAASVLCLAALGSPNAFVTQTLVHALDVRSRFTDFVMLWDVLTQLPFTWLLALGALGVALAGTRLVRAQPRAASLFVLLNMSALLNAWGGSMQIHAKIIFMAPALLVLFRLIEAWSVPTRATSDGSRLRLRRSLFTAITYTATLFLIVYATFASISPLAWHWRASNLDNTYAMKNAAFRGWRCNPEVGSGVDRAAEFLNREVSRESSVFIFPDATVLYGITGRESYRGVPFIFHLRRVPPVKRYRAEMIARLNADPPDWIVLHDEVEVTFCRTDKMIAWLEMDRLMADYEPVWRWGEFSAWRRRTGEKSEIPAAPVPTSKPK